MWYKNIAGRFFGLVTKDACNRRTDRQNYDSQDRAWHSSRGKNHKVVADGSGRGWLGVVDTLSIEKQT